MDWRVVTRAPEAMLVRFRPVRVAGCEGESDEASRASADHSTSPRQVDRLFAMMNEDVSDQPAVRDLMLTCEKLPKPSPPHSWVSSVPRSG